MSKPVDLNYAIGLAPEKAIEYFKSKGYAPSWNWHDMLQSAHNTAFTVAKAVRMNVLQDIHDAVQNAIEQGQTESQFAKVLTPKLQAKGWWGKIPIGGEGKTAQLGSPARLKTIYQTNMQTAYRAGRYQEQMANVDDRPYWQYIAVMDSRTRPAHAALNGRVFRYDDPIWQHFPGGFNCRCRTRALTAKQIKQMGLTVESSTGKLTTTYEPLYPDANKMVPVTTYSPAKGLEISTDKGWDYNPGVASLDPQTLAQSNITFILPPPTQNTPPYRDISSKPFNPEADTFDEKITSGWTKARAVEAFLSYFGATLNKPIVYTDVIGDPLVISDGLFVDKVKTKAANNIKEYKIDRGRIKYLPMLADTIKDPSEIWLTWKTESDGTERLLKRYISIYKTGKKDKIGFTVFDESNDGTWQGTTTFETDNLKYIEDQRTGTLLYRKIK